jgi:ElaB/YqjD/DUF883 family membrane-anchored ribosome-binding protein
MEWSDIAKGLGFTGGGALGGLGINWMLGNTSKKSQIIATLLGAGAGAGAWGLGYLDKDLSGDKDPLTKGDAKDIVERGSITDSEVARAEANPDSPIAKAVLDVATDQKDLERVNALKGWLGNPDHPLLSAVEPLATTPLGAIIGSGVGKLSGRPNVDALTRKSIALLNLTDDPDAYNAFSYLANDGSIKPVKRFRSIQKYFTPETAVVFGKINEHKNSIKEVKEAASIFETAKVAVDKAKENIADIDAEMQSTPSGSAKALKLKEFRKKAQEALDHAEESLKAAKSRDAIKTSAKTFDEDTMAKAFGEGKVSKGRRIGGAAGLLLGLLHGWVGSAVLGGLEAANTRQKTNSLKALKEAATK